MRKFVAAMFMLLAIGIAGPVMARGQAAVYGEFTYSDFGASYGSGNLYGGTIGVLVDGPMLFHKVLLTGDIQGRRALNSNEKIEEINVGPRFSIPVGAGFTPYAEFVTGFGRYSYSPTYAASTDGTLQVNGGMAKQLTPRFDVTAEYSYSRYFGFYGAFIPQSISVGTIFHFTKRDMPMRLARVKDNAGTKPAATHPLGTGSATVTP